MMLMQQADSVDVKRDQMATDLVDRYTAWAAAAGVIPIPVIDVAAVGGVQLKMLRELARIYEVEFSENLGKSVMGTLLGSIMPAGVASATSMGVTSALKFVPVVGTAIASIAMPACSAAATYALGKVFILHFASGGTLLDFNPKEYREFMREHATKGSSATDLPPSSASSAPHTNARTA
jgi:uncharacterized protein (DUF697 family)